MVKALGGEQIKYRLVKYQLVILSSTYILVILKCKYLQKTTNDIFKRTQKSNCTNFVIFFCAFYRKTNEKLSKYNYNFPKVYSTHNGKIAQEIQSILKSF